MRHLRRFLLALLGLALVAGPLAGGAAVAADSDPTAPASGEATQDGGDGLTWGTKPSDNEVGMGRPRFSYIAARGGSLKDGLDVYNRGTTPITLQVYATDAFNTPDGGLDMLKPEEKAKDAGTWITLDQSEVTVQPGQTVTVPFTLKVPLSAAAGDHTAGIITSFATPADVGISEDHRLAGRVYIRVKGDLEPKLSIRNVHVEYGGTWNPFGKGSAKVSYQLVNDGNVRLEGRQSVKVGGLFGLAGQTVKLPDMTELLPGQSRKYSATLSSVYPLLLLHGTVTVQPVQSTQDNPGTIPTIRPVHAGALTPAVPWVLLGILIVVVLAWLRMRRRRLRLQASVAAAISQAVAQTADVAGASTTSAGQSEASD